MARRPSRRAHNRPPRTPSSLLWLVVAAAIALGMVLYLKCRASSLTPVPEAAAPQR